MLYEVITGDELSLLTDKITTILKRHMVEEEIINDAVSVQQRNNFV